MRRIALIVFAMLAARESARGEAAPSLEEAGRTAAALVGAARASAEDAPERQILLFEDIRHQPGGYVLLTIDPRRERACAYLRSRLDVLRASARRLGGTTGPAPSDCWQEENGRVLITLNGSLPRSIAESLERVRARAGPNCYNTALRASGILSRARIVEEEEMAYWLDSPLCRPQDPSSSGPAEYPRIGAVRNRRDLPWGAPAPREAAAPAVETEHVFLQLSAEVVYSKLGLGVGSSYRLTMPRYELSGGREVPPECDGVPAPRRDCGRWVTYYRCEALADYLSAHPPAPDAGLDRARSAVDSVEARLDAWTAGEPFAADALASARAALAEAEPAANADDQDAPRALLRRALRRAISSSRLQLSILADPEKARAY